MSTIKLAEIDLEQAHFTVDLISKSPASETDGKQCDTDFEIQLGVTGMSMVFDFNQWFEAESSYVTEELGMGSISLTNMNFTLVADPYVNQEKFRLKIKDSQLQITDYKFQIHMREDSQFESTLEQYSTVFAEHMRNQVHLDLTERLALAWQKGSHNLFRRVQQNNKQRFREIFMNKHLINLCYVQGEPISRDPSGKVVLRNTGAISFEIDGTFHRSQDLLNTNSAPDIAFTGSHVVPAGAAHVYIGKGAVDSLLEAYFKESGTVEVSKDSIKIKVEDLEDMAQGFSEAFDENMMVDVTAQIDKISASQFDNDFGHIAVKAEFIVNFENPIDSRFLAA